MKREGTHVVSRCKIFDHIPYYGHSIIKSFMPDPKNREVLSWPSKNDEKNNLETTPPSEELISLRCIWGVELYTPSNIEALFGSFRKLGWDKDDHFLAVQNPIFYLKSFREAARGGGWFELGPIHRLNHKGFIFRGRTAPLPDFVDYAIARMYALTSSISCIVVGFILKDTCTSKYEEALRRQHTTFRKKIADNRDSYHGPEFQKKADVRSIRTDVRSSLKNWFKIYLPGFFASNDIDCELPTCELITLRQAQPFPPINERGDKWLWLLDIDNDFNVWQANDNSALKFGWPLLSEDNTSFHAILAAREDAFSGDKLGCYKNSGRESYVLYVNDLLNGILSRWAILGMLSVFERHLNKVRDSATLGPGLRGDPLRLLDEFSRLISTSLDITTASSELQRFAENSAHFEREVEVFTRSSQRVSHGNTVTLSQGMREDIAERAIQLQGMDSSIRDLIIQYGTVVGTHKNIRLQNRMGFLTWIIAFLTIIMAVLTALTTYIAAK